MQLAADVLSAWNNLRSCCAGVGLGLPGPAQAALSRPQPSPPCSSPPWVRAVCPSSCQDAGQHPHPHLQVRSHAPRTSSPKPRTTHTSCPQGLHLRNAPADWGASHDTFMRILPSLATLNISGLDTQLSGGASSPSVPSFKVCVCLCVHVCVVYACVCACACACVHAGVRVCVHACM